MKEFFQNHKSEIKYKNVEFEKHIYTITGIGKKAIKYQKDHGEDEFAFYDSSDFHHIACIIAKSFDSEIWNEKQYCKDNKAPHFAPEDGFCWSCGKQIYADYPSVYGTDWGRSLEFASTELVTGCPHCHRSYCD